MFGHKFYHETIRKYIIIFGTLFNEIFIYRTDSSGNQIQEIKVPLAYGPRDKTLARLEQDTNLDTEVAITLPRMSFEWIGINYATERKLNTINRNVAPSGDPSDTRKNVRSMYNPVPYDLNFELNVFSKYAEDSTKIVEQIMPFFTPEFTVTAELISDMSWKVDLPIILEAISLQDTYEADFQQRRALVNTLSFTLKGYLFAPVTESGLIKKANTQFYVDTYPGNRRQQTENPDSNDTRGTVYANSSAGNLVFSTVRTTHANGQAWELASRVTVTPGLDANGDPTTNSSLTVDSSLIDANDNYGYITNFEDFFDGDGTG